MNATAQQAQQSTPTRVLAGIPVPNTPLIARSIELARASSEPYLFNHVMRSWLFATALAQTRSIGARRRSSRGRHPAARHRPVKSLCRPAPIRSGRSERRARIRTQGRCRRSSCSADLGRRRAELDTIHQPSSRSRRSRCARLGSLLDWAGLGSERLDDSPNERDSDRVPSTRHEEAIHARRLRPRRSTAGNDLRQLRARLRRAIRAGLQGSIHGGLLAGLAVQRVADRPNHRGNRHAQSDLC